MSNSKIIFGCMFGLVIAASYSFFAGNVAAACFILLLGILAVEVARYEQTEKARADLERFRNEREENQQTKKRAPFGWPEDTEDGKRRMSAIAQNGNSGAHYDD